MERYRAIPEGYMTVGEAAKKMGVTVRTLQYYDREGMLAPSAESEGGRRLYVDKDLVKLHQILSLKYLGFSLEEIKKSLISLDSPEDVAAVLAEQAAAVRDKMERMSECLDAIEALREEVLQMQSVDFGKYADIIVNLQMKNEFYWMIKHFDDETLEHFRGQFDMDSSRAMMETFPRLLEDAVRLQNDGVKPEGREGKQFAKEFWDMIMEFTGGDMSMVSRLTETENASGPDEEWNRKLVSANAFIEGALDAYLTEAGINPFGEETK